MNPNRRQALRRLQRVLDATADPGNRWADDPAAAELGRRLFFDTRLSSNGKVACASCHDRVKEFQDGTALARGVGTTDRRTMPVAATAYSPFLFWDRNVAERAPLHARRPAAHACRGAGPLQRGADSAGGPLGAETPGAHAG